MLVSVVTLFALMKVAKAQTGPYLYYTQNEAGLPQGTGLPCTAGNNTGCSAYYQNGVGIQARFYNPQGMFSNDQGNLLFVADTNNNIIRQINPVTFQTTVFAGRPPSYIGTYFPNAIGTNAFTYFPGSAVTNGVGTFAKFNKPAGGEFNNAGNIAYVADSQSNVIRQINMIFSSSGQLITGLVTTFAGR